VQGEYGVEALTLAAIFLQQGARAETFSIGWIDIAIIVLYLLGTRAIVAYWAGRNKRDSDDYFLGGRKFIWPLIGISLFATNQSGASFVGLAGSGYADGIAVYNFEWLAAVALIVFVAFILPFYLRSEVFTLPEFLERRYSRSSRLAFSGFALITSMFIDLAVVLYGGAIVIQAITPEIPLWVLVTGIALLVGSYTIFGGLEAVVITDTIQGIVLIIGGAIVAILAFMAIPSWEAVEQATPPEGLSLIRPIGDDLTPWPGLITGAVIIGFYFWTTNQFIVQRTLGAKNLDHGRWGSLFAVVLKLPILFLMVLPGTMALVLYPNLENPDLAFPTLAFDLLPIGLRGLILAALIAAIMSSADSMLNAASTLVTMDFVRTFRPQTTQRALVNIGRVATGLLMLVAIIWAPQIENFPSLVEYLQSALSYITPPVVAVFFVGLFWKRANANGAFATLAVMVPLGIVGFVLNEIVGITEVHFLYMAFASFVISCALLAVVSLVTDPPPQEKVEEYAWRREYWQKETEELKQKPWYYNYRYLSIGLLVLTAVIVIWWW
jgi:SSS family solute:Na+ symporter